MLRNLLAFVTNSLRISVTALGLVLAVSLAFAGNASANSAQLNSLTSTGDGLYSASITSTYDQCFESYCGWFPVAHWVSEGQSCPNIKPDVQYVLVGDLLDDVGSQTNTGTFYSSASAFTICVYIHTDTYQLVASIPWSATSPGSEAEADPTQSVESMSLSDARYYTKRFLRRKFGRRFTRGAGFRQICSRNSRIEFRCRVSWRRNGLYRGNVWHEAYVEDDGEQMIYSSSSIRYYKKKKKKKSKNKSRGNCDSSYPTVCIPPPPPDLDCPEISHTNFRVTGSDPHGFDGDRDGIGCET